MKQRIHLFLIASLVCMLLFNVLNAGTTGKITGVVTDATTGEPLVGVNIIIQGTSMGIATDIEGNYVILNIPPGEYTLQVSMVGYQPVQLRSVNVSVDLTTTMDVKLQSSAVELEARVITAERPLVLKDNTGSLSTISADQIRSMPVQTIAQILRLDAGIVEFQGQLHMRGGRSGEISYWVDGISTTDVFNGLNGVRVENLAVQELQVISGTFNAEYGQAMSGIVNTITKEGGEKYSGQIRLYGGDYISNRKEFNLYKKVTVAADPNKLIKQGTGLQEKVVSAEKADPLMDFNPIYNGEASLSGPFPLLGNNVRFFAMGRYFYDEGYFYGVNWYKPNGTPGDNKVVALNPNKSITLQGKLSYQLSSTIKATYGIYWSKNDQDRSFYTGVAGGNNHDYKYVPYAFPQSHSNGQTHIFTLNHVLSPSTFYELRVSNYYSASEQYLYKNPLQKTKYLVQRGTDSTTFDYDTPAGQDTLNAIIARGETYTYVPDPNSPDGYIDPQSISAPTSYTFLNKGQYSAHNKRSTGYWVGKFDLTSQINRTNEIKLGLEGRLHELTLHNYNLVPKKDANGNEIKPYQPAIPEVGNTGRNDYLREPIELSAYLQDKMEFKDIILNIGLRFDYFDANSHVPTDPTDPNIYDPLQNKHIYYGWVDKPASYAGTLDQYIQERLDAGLMRKYTPNERRAFMQKKVEAKMALSPRLGFSFPITDKGIIHFSYGHFFQTPQFQYLYQNPDFKITSSSGDNTQFGNPDLEPQKTAMYEIGLQQQLSEAISVDATLFYRDVRGWVGTSRLVDVLRDNGRNINVQYSIYQNSDYSNVKGITLKIERRFLDRYSFRADYTYQVAEGTYSNVQDAANAERGGQAPVLALLPLNWDQPHTVNVQGMYSVSDWTFSVIGRYWTGTPYTPNFIPEQSGQSAVTGYTSNSARLPDRKTVDITVNKTIRLADMLSVQLFVNVYNLFDQRDVNNVYTDTGSPDYSSTIAPDKVPYDPRRISTVEDFVLQPAWFSGPRQIQAGLAVDF